MLLLVSLLLTVTSFAQLPTTGLVAWYPFCGNAVDRSGNGLDLTVSGPSLSTDRFAGNDNAYHYSGSTTVLGNSIFRVPPLPDTGAVTFAAWVNADTGGNQVILANGDLGSNGLGIVTTGHNVAVQIGGSGIYLPTYLTYHQWHHLLLRRSGVTYSFYLDTIIIGSFVAPFTPAPATQSFSLGQDHNSGSRSFHGSIDDVAVYSKALSSTEISALYHFYPDVHAVLGPDAAVCAGFSTTLSPSPQYPGLDYIWSNGATDTSITADTFGSYWFSITRPYGCSTSDTITFTLGIVSVSIGRDTLVCPGDTFTIVATAPAGSTYLWNTGDTTATLPVTTPGTYSIHIDNAGCPGYDTMVFGNSPVPLVDLGNDTTLCSVQPLTLSSSHTYTNPAYLWSTGATSSSILPTTSGTYALRVLVDGCAGYDTINVRFKPVPVVAFGPDRRACTGDSITLSGTGDTNTIFLWSTGDTVNTITIKATGTYWLTANDSGCIATDTFKYTVFPYPQVHLGTDIFVCQGTPVVLSSSDSYTAATYNWSTGAHTATINVITTGNYTLTVTENGCASTDNVTVTIKPIPVVNLGSDTYFCSGSSVSLSSPQPVGALYIWSTGDHTSSINVTSPGLYGLVVNNNGCIGSDSIYIDEITVPSLTLGGDTTICQGFTYDLNINGESATYMWSDGTMGTTYHVDRAGTIWASISNVCGIASDTVNVRYRFCDMWLPTAFSPNGDGRNDIIRVLGSLGSYSEYHFAVFNRWGVSVYATEDINSGWDGTFNGEPQNIGTYFYMITCKLNGQDYNMTGNFELVR